MMEIVMDETSSDDFSICEEEEGVEEKIYMIRSKNIKNDQFECTYTPHPNRRRNGLYKGIVNYLTDYRQKFIGNFRFDNKNDIQVIEGSLFVNDELYVGEFRDNMKHGEGTFFNSSGKYLGHWERNKKSGDGKLINKDGSYYDGCWMNDLFHGYGTYKWKCGDIYLGNFEYGKKTGYGTYEYKNNEHNLKYEGVWVNDMKDGVGKLTTKKGFYDGELKNDQMDGNGVYVYNDGYTYKGSFEKGKRHGFGDLQHKYLHDTKKCASLPNGTIVLCNGNWKNDKLDGKATVHYQNRDNYNGNFKNGLRNGRGKMEYVNNDIYEGQWVNDKKNGRGTYIYAKNENNKNNCEKSLGRNYEKYEGGWKDDIKEGQGTLSYDDGSKFEGTWKNGKINGKGNYNYYVTLKDGEPYREKFEGVFKNNMKHGHGLLTCFFNNRVKKIDGIWKDDKLNGEGSETHLYGKNNKKEIIMKFEGQWKNGIKHGLGIQTFGDYDDKGPKVLNGEWKKGKFFTGNIIWHDGVRTEFWTMEEKEFEKREKMYKDKDIQISKLKNEITKLTKKLKNIKDNQKIHNLKIQQYQDTIKNKDQKILQKKNEIKSINRTFMLKLNDKDKKISEYEKNEKEYRKLIKKNKNNNNSNNNQKYNEIIKKKDKYIKELKAKNENYEEIIKGIQLLVRKPFTKKRNMSNSF